MRSKNIDLDERDIEILKLIQGNCKLSTKQIASKIGSPITTIYARIKRMEELGVIKGYNTVLDAKSLGKKATAFILASVAYTVPKLDGVTSQRKIAEEISKFPEVQEVHIISGDWDLIIKVRAEDTEAMGHFVVDKLRTVLGIEKTLTCMVFETVKEGTTINL